MYHSSDKTNTQIPRIPPVCAGRLTTNCICAFTAPQLQIFFSTFSAVVAIGNSFGIPGTVPVEMKHVLIYSVTKPHCYLYNMNENTVSHFLRVDENYF